MSTLEKTIDIISSMPENEVEQIYTYILSLKTKAKKSATEEKKVYRTPGGMQGKLWMVEDFDATPDCFKDYM